MNVMQRFTAFYDNPTKVKNVDLIGSDADEFVSNLKSFNIYRTVREGYFDDIFPATAIPHVDYRITRVKFRSSSEVTFRVRSFDLDKIDHGEFYSYIFNNKLRDELSDSPLVGVEGASIQHNSNIICIHNSGFICDHDETTRFLLRTDEKEVDMTFVLKNLGSAFFLRSKIKIYPTRMEDDLGPFFISFDEISDPCVYAKETVYRLMGSGFHDPIYSVVKRYFKNDLLSYLRNVQEQVVPDLQELASPDHYTSPENVEKYLKTCGLENYKDAESIVIAIKGSSFSGLKRVLIRGEGFGFLVYHFSKYLPNIQVFGFDPSPEMCRVAKSFGIQVHSTFDTSPDLYDYEIMMNVLAVGLQPILPRVLIFDKNYLFDGNSGFVTCGGLMFRNLEPCYNVLKCCNKRMTYSTVMHNGTLHVEQKEAAERVYNTIGAKGTSLSLKLENFGFPPHRVVKKITDATAFVFSSSTDLSFSINSSVPNYLVDHHAHLVFPGCMDDWSKDLDFEFNGFHYIGLPSGEYHVCTAYRLPGDDRVRSQFNVKNERRYVQRFKLNENVKYQVFYLNTRKDGYERGVIFFLYPVCTSKNKVNYPYKPRLFTPGKSPPFDGLDCYPDIENIGTIYKVLAPDNIYNINPYYK